MCKTISLLAALLLLSLTLASAQTGKRRSKGPRQPVAKPASAAITTPTGLTYIITRRGTGRLPKAGETVVVHYTGALTDGKKFDSSRDGDGQPLEFKLGVGRVIKGWDEGIAKLHIGDQAILIIPSTLGYGAKGTGQGLIPPNATLIFIVELVDVKGASISADTKRNSTQN